MEQYKDYITKILDEGETHTNERTGIDCTSIFGHSMKFDMDDGFPLVTMKYTAFRLIAVELCWFLRAGNNVKWLREHDCRIWDEWAKSDGSLGPVYGYQWRSWLRHDGTPIDQMRILEEKIKGNPSDRAMIVSCWNVADLDSMALRPCHLMFQCSVRPESRRLDLQVYQRSADSFLGVPFNIASYALLLCILAKRNGLRPGTLTWVGGDCHLYGNHMNQVRKMMGNPILPMPQLYMDALVNHVAFENMKPEWFQVANYKHGGSIKAPVAV